MDGLDNRGHDWKFDWSSWQKRERWACKQKSRDAGMGLLCLEEIAIAGNVRLLVLGLLGGFLVCVEYLVPFIYIMLRQFGHRLVFLIGHENESSLRVLVAL